MSWMHYLVGVSHFAKYGTNRPLTVWEILTNVQKSHSIIVNKMKKWPGIHTQIRITTKSQSLLEGRSPLAHICQVWSTSISAFVSYPVYIFRSVCPSDLSQNVVDALSCRRQSFRQVWYKSAVDCMRNTTKCPKIPYSAMVKKMKRWSGIHTHFRITTKSQSLLEGRSPVAHVCQVWSTSVSAFISYPVYRTTERIHIAFALLTDYTQSVLSEVGGSKTGNH